MHSEGVIYYARAIQDALALGPYIQFHIWLQMVDNPEMEIDTIGDLTALAREEYIEPEEGPPPKVDSLGTWDAWDAVRKACKYHTRLFVGEHNTCCRFLPHKY
jgi:protein arginine N-methyltransferase 5